MGSVIPAPWRGKQVDPLKCWPVYPNQWAWDQMKHPFSKIKEGGSCKRHRYWWRTSAWMHTHMHMDPHAHIRHTPMHVYTYINICRGPTLRCPWSLFHCPSAWTHTKPKQPRPTFAFLLSRRMSGTMNIVLFLASTKQEQGCRHYGMRFEALFIYFFPGLYCDSIAWGRGE